MKDTSYAYAVARLRAVENSLLSGADIEALLAAKNETECMRILNDKGYNAEENDASEVFKEETKKMWRLIYEILPEPSVFDIFLYKNDFHNLKIIIKGLASGKDYKPMLLEPYTVSPETIEKCVHESNFSALPEMMAQAADEAYLLLTRENDVRAASVVIDNASLIALLQGALRTGDKFLIDFVRKYIDCINIKTALRCAKTARSADFISKCLINADSVNVSALALAAAGGYESCSDYLSQTDFGALISEADGDFSVFEKLCDDMLLKTLTSAKYTAFGLAPVLAYIYAKETEIKTVHIILTSKASGLADDLIRGRLRMLYV